MLSSLAARHVALRALVSHPQHISAISRRTLFATPLFNSPPASPVKKTTPKAAKTKAPAKKARPSKSAAVKKKEDKPKTRIPKELKPPKRAPGPYCLFFSSFIKSQPKATTLQEAQELSRRAGQVWNGYTMAEKQPFYDENESRKIQAKEERDEFFRNTSASHLKQLNAIRKAQGKPKVRTTQKTPHAVSPFILFSNAFRNSTEGQALIEKTALDKKYPIRAVVAAAGRWNSMTQAEKAPYFESYYKAKNELVAQQSSL